MSTYQLSTVRTRIQQKLDNTAFDSAKLNQFINDGQRELLNGLRLPTMESEATATTAVGSDLLTYAVIAGTPPIQTGLDIQQILSIRVYDPTTKATILPYKSYEYVDEHYPNVTDTDHAFPSFFYTFGGVIHLYPEADDIYTIKVRYIKKPTELTADADVPEVPEEYSELLVLTGYKRALEHEDNFDQAQVIQQTIDEQKQNMAVRLGSRQMGQPYIIKQPRRR